MIKRAFAEYAAAVDRAKSATEFEKIAKAFTKSLFKELKGT